MHGALDTFHSCMSGIPHGLPFVASYFDDVVKLAVYINFKLDLLQRICSVLSSLHGAGLAAKPKEGFHGNEKDLISRAHQKMRVTSSRS